MKRVVKFVAIFAGTVALLGFSGQAKAQYTYSCTNSTYGSTYSACSANNTANQASTVATSTAVLRVAASQTSKLVSNRVSAALSGGASGVRVSANGFSASTGISAGNGVGKTGIWASGSWSNVEDKNPDTQFEGNVSTGMAGIDHLFDPNVAMGIAIGFENVDIDTEFNGFNGQDGNLEGDGFTVAPYIGVRLNKNASADLTVGYSDISYDTLRFDPQTGNQITGSTDAERYFVNAGINGSFPLSGNWRLKSRASIFYASEEKDAFIETESNGATVAVADSDTELGQILADMRLGYMMTGIEPYALVGLEYDYTKDDTPVAAGQTVTDDDFGAKLGVGANINISPNIRGGVEAYTVEFRDDYSEFTTTGGLRVQF